MVDGFRIDVTALQQAAAGVANTIFAVQQQRVNKIDPDRSAFGHDHLADTLSAFCDRWHIGVGHLTSDGQEFSGRLTDCAIAYAKADHQGADLSNGILQATTGADPAGN